MENEIAFIRVETLNAPLPDDLLLKLKPALQAAGYDEKTVAPFFFRLRGPADRIAMLEATATDKPVDALCRLFQLSRWVEKEKIVGALGEEVFQRACEWAILADIEGRVGSTVDIYPLGDDYIVTDRMIVPGGFEDGAYPLGGDSYTLSRMIPRTRVKKALDLCTGSGVQALTVKADLVHAVELSDRAWDFANFNLSFNRPNEVCRVFQGDLYSPLPLRDYNLIVTNPPWVPAPQEEMELYRGGGANGEYLTKKIVEGLPRYLAQDGWFVMYVEYPLYDDGETYHQRMRRWLGEGTWGIASFQTAHLTAQQYALGQVASHDPKTMHQDYKDWLKLYANEGIQAMEYAVVFARRTSKEWDAVIHGTPPQEPQLWVAEWLETLLEPGEGPAQLSPMAKLWTSGEEGRVEWPGTCLKPLELTPQELAVVQGKDEDPAIQADLRRRLVLA